MRMSRRAFVGFAGTALLAGCSKAEQEETPADESAAAAKTSEPESKDGASAGDSADSGAASGARPSKCGRLHVDGTQLVDASGNPAQLRGFSTHGLAWFPQYVNVDAFAELAGWGANVARLALYAHESGGYCTDGDQAALRELVERGVQFAADADLYAIVDWHVLQELDPNVYLDQAKEFWGWASARFSDSENVLYEICNEPNGSTTWADIKRYAEEVIPVIRANDPNALILVGTPNWSQQPDAAAADPLSDANVMYTLHFYAATHKDELRGVLRSAVEGGAPVFVSEYGICDASGTGALDLESAAAWCDLMDGLGVSHVCWNLSNKAESSAFIRSGCEKTSGFADEDLTECGAWLKARLSGEAIGSSGTGGAEESGRDSGSMASGDFTLSSAAASGGLEIATNLRQSWESGGKKYLLYDVALTNTSGQTVDDWSFDLSFTGNVALSDSWNAQFSVSGNSVHATPAAYNAQLPAGSTIGDIGLIVYPA